MKTRFINKIDLDKKNIPYKWMENLVSNGKIGGCMLVFIEGFSEAEIQRKVQSIKNHCKTLQDGLEVNYMDTFRKEYTPLDEEQKTQMAQVKDKAQELLDLFNSAVPVEERSERSRCMALARTNLETTIMWAVKGVTTAK